jgi:hypothetical protein
VPRAAAFLLDGAEPPPAGIPGVGDLRVGMFAGAPETVGCLFEPGRAPTILEAAAALGAWRELPRLPGTPRQGVFGDGVGGCDVIGLTLDPAGAPGGGTLTELSVAVRATMPGD